MTDYQAMTSILKPNVNPSKEDIKRINSYFFCTWLSNNKFTLKIAEVLNLYYKIPVYAQFRFADDYAKLTGMANRIKFIGFNKKQSIPEIEKTLDNIQRYYKVNRSVAEEYFNLMPDEEKTKFYKMYNEGIEK